MTDGDGLALGGAAGVGAGAGALAAGAAGLGACGAGAAGFFSGSLILLLENMTCGLDIVCGVDGGAVQPDFIMQVDAGAAPRAAHISDMTTFFHPVVNAKASTSGARLHRFKSESMAYFDEIGRRMTGPWGAASACCAGSCAHVSTPR